MFFGGARWLKAVIYNINGTQLNPAYVTKLTSDARAREIQKSLLITPLTMQFLDVIVTVVSIHGHDFRELARSSRHGRR